MNRIIISFKFFSQKPLRFSVFISDISSQMHSSPLAFCWVTLIFVLFLLSAGENKAVAYPRRREYAFKGCLIHIHLQDAPHFDSLILLNTFLCNFLLVFWLAIPTFMFSVCFCQSSVFFCRKSVLVFVKLIWVCCKPSGWSQFR